MMRKYPEGSYEINFSEEFRTLEDYTNSIVLFIVPDDLNLIKRNGEVYYKFTLSQTQFSKEFSNRNPLDCSILLINFKTGKPFKIFRHFKLCRHTGFFHRFSWIHKEKTVVFKINVLQYMG